jgi:glycosyltransferase involved in cell wall biosynthesis
MRIGLVTPGFSASEDDWCVPALLDLVRELSGAHDVYVLALRYPHHRGRYRVYGATVESLGAGEQRGLGRVPMLWQALAAIRREARRARFDVLHALWAHEPGLVVALAGARLGVPTVVSVLGGELTALPDIGYGGGLSAANRTMAAFALARTDAVTAGSRLLAGELAARGRAERVHVAPLGVDHNLFVPQAKDDDPALRGAPALLHVASLSAVKDQATLLRAFALFLGSRPGAHLHVVGDGDRRPQLEHLAAGLGVASATTFHGAVPHDRLPGYYRAASACVLSSRFESQSMVALEAAACGRLTLGIRVGVLSEIGGDDATVPPADPAALAALLARHLAASQGPPLPPRIARDALAADYGVPAAADRLCSLYRSLSG